MPDDETTTQVAPASDPADASVAQAEPTQATQGVAAEANGEPTPEPDIKAEFEKAKAELAQERPLKLAAEKRAIDAEKRAADAENLVRTQAGAQSASDRRANDFDRKLQRLTDIVEAGLTSPDAAAEIGRLKTAHRDEDQVSFSSFIAGQSRTNTAALVAAGFTDADWNNEDLADGFLLWEGARNAGDRAGIERASQSLMRGIKRMQAAKSAVPTGVPSLQPAAGAATATNGATRRIANMDAGTGIGVGNVSMPTLVERYGSDYDSLTPAQRKSAEDYMRREGLI